MKLPRMKARLRVGLREIHRLAEADALADQVQYPPSHPIWDALLWLAIKAQPRKPGYTRETQ